MKNYQKHIIYWLIIILIINTINVAFYYIEHTAFPEFSDLFKYLGWSVYFTTGLYLVNMMVIRWVYNRYPEFDLRSVAVKFIVGTLGCIAVSLIAGAILYTGLLLYYGNSLSGSFWSLFGPDSGQDIRLIVWLATSIAIIMQANSLIQHYQSTQLSEQKKRVTRISTEHESLKSQLNSHFLFNSLNVLTGLIDENPEKAQEFVGELSSVYRYVLEQKDKDWVPVGEEISFCRNYMELIKKRYEEGLIFEIESELFDDYMIAPLTLQILIENCIKHNRISSEEPLCIKVYSENDYLIVENNLQLKKQLRQTTGKGLEHILSRYDGFENKVEILQNEKDFTVKIPLITKKNINMEINRKYTEEEYKQASERVEQIQGFYWNLASYIVVNAFLTFLDIKEDGVYNWAYWPLIGWGIGLLFHAINVFGVFNNSDWKTRMIQKELEKSKRQRDLFDSKY